MCACPATRRAQPNSDARRQRCSFPAAQSAVWVSDRCTLYFRAHNEEKFLSHPSGRVEQSYGRPPTSDSVHKAFADVLPHPPLGEGSLGPKTPLAGLQNLLHARGLLEFFKRSLRRALPSYQCRSLPALRRSQNRRSATLPFVGYAASPRLAPHRVLVEAAPWRPLRMLCPSTAEVSASTTTAPRPRQSEGAGRDEERAGRHGRGSLLLRCRLWPAEQPGPRPRRGRRQQARGASALRPGRAQACAPRRGARAPRRRARRPRPRQGASTPRAADRSGGSAVMQRAARALI